MKRIDDHTVELTDEEMMASEFFEDLLDEGHGIYTAVAKVKEYYPDLDPDFFHHLSH